MLRKYLFAAMLMVLVFGKALLPQANPKIDFRRDVQPLLKTYCIDCHGPSKQMNNFRLDRRRDAMKGGTMAVIGPGNSAGSRLYLRLLGTQYGKQMPLTGALNPEQIDIIKTWIDQGAEWPDDVSGETVPPPPDPRATRMMETLRRGDRQSFEKMLADDPKVASLRGPGGSTPLMYAVLYGNSETVRALLDSGADPSIRNDAGATALMWAADDIDKMRLLLERGADANARSDDGRTPLMIAAGRFGSSALVKLLLDHGANPSAKCPGLITDKTPLSEAAYAGDEAVVGMLIERGADIKSAGFLPLSFALRANSAKCVDMLIKSASREVLNIAMFIAAPPLGDAHTIKLLLDRGADVNAKDPAGRTILMLAACSDALPVETVKTLIERGADVNAKSATGETALDLAKQRGETTIVDLLIKAGAKQSGGTTELAIKPKPATSVRTAIERSIPLLQRTDVAFIQKSACVSCHHNTLTAMTVATARKNGLPINDDTARAQLKTIASYIDTWRERLLQGIGIPGDADTVSYFLLGMAAEKYAPDASTDALARYLRSRQSPEGHWLIFAHRPPLESSNIEVTATSMRAIQVYAPKAQRSEYERAVQLAAGWLIKAQPKSTEDRAFQILGLAWAGANKDVIRKAARELLSEQRPDGGWAQLPSLVSDAYATGQALVALKEAGALAATTPAYRRGTQFLLNSQLEDGSWYVKSRALPIQPFFESGFPHGHDQWISAAATNWATMALAHAAR